MPMADELGSLEYGHFSFTPFKFLGLVIFLVWFYNTITKRSRLRFDLLGLFILLLMFLGLASTLFSEYTVFSFSLFSSFFLFFPLYLVLTSTVEDVGFLKRLICVLAISVFLTSVIGVLQHLDLFPGALPQSIEDRSAGLAGNANEFGLFLVCILPFVVYFYSIEKSSFWKLLAGFGISFITIALFTTGSRAVLVSYAVVLLFFLSKKRTWFVIAMCVLAVVLLALVPVMFSRFEGASVSNAIAIRKILIQKSFDAFRSNPLNGVGYSTITFYTVRGLVTHNAYVQVLAEMGLPALIVFLAIFLISFRNLRFVKVRCSKSLSNPDCVFASNFAELVQLALLIYLIVLISHSFFYDKLMWFFISLTSVIKNIAEKWGK